jgi:arylsulfatase A-like enzyme
MIRLLAATLVAGLITLAPEAHAAPAAAPASPAATSRPNVVIVLMDALRADALGVYGNARKPSPNIDAWAAGASRWQTTVSQNAWTVPCVASLMTGLDPQAHRVLRYQGTQRVEMDTLSLSHDTLAEQFKAAGYTTGALLKSVVIDSSRGFSQGFDTYRVVEPKKDQAWGESAKHLTDAALGFLDQEAGKGKPFFLYLHYMDSHSPYKAPEPWYSKYKGTYTGPFDGAHAPIEQAIKSGNIPTAADWAHLKALYDGELAYFDSQLQRVFDAIAAKGLASNTIVVLTADHGEAFWEHGVVFHGNLYQENIHIPMIVRGPGIKPGVLGRYTQAIDLAPTLADLAGVPKGKNWMGTSQAGPMRQGGNAAPQVVYTEYIEQRMVIDGATGMKLIVNDGPVKLYDLAKDPGEKTNLAASRPDEVKRLRALLDARYARGRALGQATPAEATRTLSQDEVEMLKELGYVQ